MRLIGLAVVLTVGLALAPLAAEAQPTEKVARLGFTPELGARSVAAVREGLGELGWYEGQNVQCVHRYASGKREQLATLAAELIQQKVDVIVAFGTDATRAARGATSSIPIVMGAVADPIGSGFVTSLARPGGNVTGTSLMTELIGKQLQLLREVAPRASRIGVISLGGMPHDRSMKEADAAAPHHGVKVHRIILREPLTLNDLAPQLRMASVTPSSGCPTRRSTTCGFGSWRS